MKLYFSRCLLVVLSILTLEMNPIEVNALIPSNGEKRE